MSGEIDGRIVIDRLLREAGWNIEDKSQVATEERVAGGRAEHRLLNPRSRPVAVVESKRFSKDPSTAKAQAEAYARKLDAPFIFLSNGEVTYFWEYDRAPERLVGGFFTREGLQRLAALRRQCPIHPTCPTTPNPETPPLTVTHRWPTGRLGEVADVSKERIEPSAHASENFHYIGLEHIEPHTGRLLAVGKIRGAEILRTKNVFRRGQILYGKLRPYLNKVHLAQMNGICSTDVFVLDTKPTRARPAFVAYFPRSADVLRRVAELVEGANLPRINRDDLLSLSIPLPPLSEQERIVGILDEAEGLRQRRAEADRRTAELLPALFHQMFGDPATHPKGWPVEFLGNFCSPKQWPTISMKDLTENGYPVYGANGRIGFYREYNHEHATLLVTCRGATCGTINVCEPKSYVTGNAMALDDPSPTRVTVEYLEHALKARGLRDTISGSAQPQITRANLSKVLVPLPPLWLQREFAARVAEVRELERRQAESGADWTRCLQRCWTAPSAARCRPQVRLHSVRHHRSLPFYVFSALSSGSVSIRSAIGAPLNDCASSRRGTGGFPPSCKTSPEWRTSRDHRAARVISGDLFVCLLRGIVGARS